MDSIYVRDMYITPESNTVIEYDNLNSVTIDEDDVEIINIKKNPAE